MPKQDEKDVKEFEETSHVDDSDDSKEKEEESDKDESSESEEKSDETKDDSKDDEKDTHADSSTDKKPDSESSEEKEDESDKSEEDKEQLKDGIVETPREKALRLEIENLRGTNRKKKADDLFVGSESPAKKQEIAPDRKEKLKKFDPKEIENLREVLDIIGEDLGYVKKDDYQKQSYQNQAKDILDTFLEEHQEYDPTNDKDDVLWNRFQSEFKLYRLPENPRDLKRLFKKIHNDVVGIKPQSDLRKIEADKEKITSASHSAAKSKSKKQEQVVDRSNSSVDRETARKGLKGFTDEEIDDLLS